MAVVILGVLCAGHHSMDILAMPSLEQDVGWWFLMKLSN